MDFYLGLIALPYKQTKEESARRTCPREVLYASIKGPEGRDYGKAQLGLRPA